MRRREVLAGLCFTATLSRGQAQPLPNALSRIAFLTASVPTRTYLLEALRTGLRELGYVEGQSIAIETRYAGGRVDLLPGMAAELIAWKPHVIVAPETPAALAAKGATATLPIIFAIVGDPVSVGLIKDFAHPGERNRTNNQQCGVAGQAF